MSVPSSFLAHMKRLVRSALDPLPRSLSVRSLAILVTMLVAGVAISVREYLESGRVSAHASTCRRISDEGAPRTHPSGSRASVPVGTSFEVEPAPAQRTTACDRKTESGAATQSTPGVWIPDSRTSGS